MLERSIPLEFKFAAPDAGEIVGLASTFGNADAMGDIVAPGAFAATIAEHTSADTMPAMLWAHQMGEPIGRWVSMRETERGLEVRGKLSDVPRARDARTLAADGALGLSIGFRPGDYDTNDTGNRVLRAVELVEISLVAVPANSRAKITSVKSGEPITPRMLESILRDAGVPKAMAVGVVTKGYRGATDDRREADDAAIQSIVNSLAVATAALRKGF